jgi:hypothetical protein
MGIFSTTSMKIDSQAAVLTPGVYAAGQRSV